jgi:hypothetical protein
MDGWRRDVIRADDERLLGRRPDMIYSYGCEVRARMQICLDRQARRAARRTQSSDRVCVSPSVKAPALYILYSRCKATTRFLACTTLSV